MAATRILVVDDEKPLREFIGRNLAARGFKIFYAANGLEALALFNTEALDLIIMDCDDAAYGWPGSFPPYSPKLHLTDHCPNRIR